MGQGLPQHITLEGKGTHRGGKLIRCLASSSQSLQPARSSGQLPTESHTQGSPSVPTHVLQNLRGLLVSEEKLSLDFLPVDVFQPTSKMLKEPKGITSQKQQSKFPNLIDENCSSTAN